MQPPMARPHAGMCRRTRAARWLLSRVLVLGAAIAAVHAASSVALVASVAHTCSSSAQCHGFQCSDSLCDCGNEWYEPDCERSYIDELGASWSIFLAIVGVVHLVLAAVAGSILVMSRRERGWSAKLNSREWTVVVTLAGCFLRFLWATRDRSIIHRPEENAWFEAMLLRLPQVLWMGGSVILINVWVRLVHQFGSRADYDRVASRCKCMSAAFMAVLAALGLPLTVYSSVVSPDFVVSQLANLLFSAYLIGLTVAGTVYVRKMLRLLDTYQRTLDANNSGRSPGAGVVGPMRDRRAVFMRRLVVFVSVSCVLGWEVVVFTVVNIVADLQAKLFPVAHLVFMYDVHVVAEGGFAAVYCYVCWGRSVASAKYAAPSARRVAGSPGSARGVALPPAPTSSGSSRRSKSDKGGSRAASAPTAAGGDQHRAARGAGDGGGGARGGHADASRDVAFENPVRSATASKPRATTGTASDRRSSAIVV